MNWKRSSKEMIMENTTEEKCMRAIEFFFTEGFIDELTSDKKHYTKILLDKVADDYNIKLKWEDTDE